MPSTDTPRDAEPDTTPAASRPGLPLVGIVVIMVGLTIMVAAVLSAIVGEKSPTTQVETERGPDSPNVTDDVNSQPYRVVKTRGGEMSFEAPIEWSTLVDSSGSADSFQVVGAGAVPTTLEAFKDAKTDGIVAVLTDPTEATSAGLVGAILGNSTIFCPPTHCTTGKPTEVDQQLPSPVAQVDTQYTIASPAVADGPGEFRYTIETEAPTRYVVLMVHAVDPDHGADVLAHAVASLHIG